MANVRRLRVPPLAVLLIGAVGSACGESGDAPSTPTHVAAAPRATIREHAVFCAAQLDRAAEDYRALIADNPDPSAIPHSFDGTRTITVPTRFWTSGFVAGSLWYLFEHTHDPDLRAAAETWTEALYPERHHTSDHDVGFIIGSSYGQGYRLTEKRDYADVLVQAANSLATRFSDRVGAIRSWDNPKYSYPVIIDNMMNLELLWKAHELNADSRLAQIATSHADKTLANHFRADMSSYHVVDYDPGTGAVIAKKTAQGLADESAWARGQAWSLYGFTVAYRETGETRFLERARAIADFYTHDASMPYDAVPFFDFDAPQRDDVPDHRDASAGAVAASALLELAQYVPTVGAEYVEFAMRALRSLSSAAFRARPNSNGHFLLLHSVGSYPAQREIDVPLNYADYYYVEALMRCKALGSARR